MLLGQDSFEVCSTIRRDSDMPILMLTARGEVTDRVVGLELGADDYLAKPFEPRQLVARIHNSLKRSRRTGDLSDVLSYSDLRVDRRKQQVRIRNELLVLTTREFQLLELLAASLGVKCSRDQIIAALRASDAELFSRAVDISISRPRNTRKPTQPIKTVWGLGYMFVE